MRGPLSSRRPDSRVLSEGTYTMAQKEAAPQTPAAIATTPVVAQTPPKGNLYTVMQSQLDKASRTMGLNPEVYTILSQPKTELIVNFPVRLDSGKYVLFKGYRVQHNNILGPYKGGIRYHEDVSLDELK